MLTKSRQRTGFTLIELLVVVSIIALLVSILLPALSGAKNKSQQVKCAANMRGLLQGLNMYTSEWDGFFPPNGIVFPKPGPFGNGVSDQQKWKLEQGALLERYANNDKRLFLCPTDDMQRAQAGQLVQDADGTIRTLAAGESGKGYWSFSVNTVLNSEGQFRLNFTTTPKPWIDPMRINQIQNPNDFVAMIEEDATSRLNDEVFDAPAYNGGDKLTDRHNRGGNVGFMYGNVEQYNEVLFNQVPAAGGGGGGPLDHYTAMMSPYTRKFFPDNGNFALQLGP